MREIKFRAFNTESQRMFSFEDLVDSWNFQDVDWINKGRSKSVLMQFTGLKDKNGVEIYEGDIITCDIAEGLGEPRLNDRKQVVTIGLYGNSISVFHTNIKIIGNVHQNPELL